jgi:hypothetical protein
MKNCCSCLNAHAGQQNAPMPSKLMNVNSIEARFSVSHCNQHILSKHHMATIVRPCIITSNDKTRNRDTIIPETIMI